MRPIDVLDAIVATTSNLQSICAVVSLHCSPSGAGMAPFACQFDTDEQCSLSSALLTDHATAHLENRVPGLAKVFTTQTRHSRGKGA